MWKGLIVNVPKAEYLPLLWDRGQSCPELMDNSFSSVLGKSNMGGSPKLAVDNIKEILNINQQRSDYLGEAWRHSQLCCPCRGRGGGARGACLHFQRGHKLCHSV